MHTKTERYIRESLRNDGWSDEDIDAVMRDEEEMEELLIEDECFFDQFMEAHVENN